MAREYVGRSGYASREIEACNSVLLELSHILGEFRDSMVLVGGGVPPLLMPEVAVQHCGTADIDLALNIDEQPADTYSRFRETLLRHGYAEGEQPYIFFRDVPTGDGDSILVEVDFLAAEYGGTGKSHRTQHFDDARPRKARGCDLAFTDYLEIEVKGTLPEGGQDSQTIKICNVASFLVMKSIALNDRLKPKDAYDIYFVISKYDGGVEAIAEKLRPIMSNALVREALGYLRKGFESVDHFGPGMVSDFEEIDDPEEIARVRRDAFERVNHLLAALDIVSDL